MQCWNGNDSLGVGRNSHTPLISCKPADADIHTQQPIHRNTNHKHKPKPAGSNTVVRTVHTSVRSMVVVVTLCHSVLSSLMLYYQPALRQPI